MAGAVNALQNHPGDVEYPVRSRRRYTRALEAKRKADPAEMRRRALPVTLIAAPVGIAAFVLSFIWDVTDIGLNFFAFFVGMCLGLLIASIILARLHPDLRRATAGAPREAPRRRGRRTLVRAARASLKQLHSALDEQFKIVTNGDAELLAHSEGAGHMMSRVAALAELRTLRWPAASVPWPSA